MAKIKDIMTTEIISCLPQTSIKEAATLLVKNHISAMPVMAEEKLVGVVREQDLLKVEKSLKIPQVIGFLGAAIYMDNPLDGDEIEKQLKEVLAAEVSEVMNKDFVSVDIDLDIHQLAELMVEKNIDMAPVLSDGSLVGIVSRSDLIKLLQ